MIDVSHVSPNEPLRVLIGAGEQSWPGWIATQGEQLNLLRRDDWAESFARRRPDRLVCEHVWEHLAPDESRAAAATCFEFLVPGGTLRVAVPDANFRDDGDGGSPHQAPVIKRQKRRAFGRRVGDATNAIDRRRMGRTPTRRRACAASHRGRGRRSAYVARVVAFASPARVGGDGDPPIPHASALRAVRQIVQRRGGR